VFKDAQGKVSNSTAEVSPLDAVKDLPVRVLTSWWTDQAAGTNLTDLDGHKGKVSIEISVENLTTQASEIAYESNGARYRQQALVGVPFTVVVTANLGQIPLEDVLLTGQNVGWPGGDKVTDGTVSVTPDGEVLVQWARLLAPPVLPPTAVFSLVVQADGFQPPAFDMVIQPGLVTDPSVKAMVDRAFGEDSAAGQLEVSTIALVLTVTRHLTEALDFVDQVHETLQGDVTDLSHKVVSELEASSETVLAHLEAMQAEIAALGQSTEGGIETANSQAGSSVSSLVQSADALLGQSGTKPKLTATSVTGCTVKMPNLAKDEPRTVAASIHLLGAQLEAIEATFTGQTGYPDTINCRTQLIRIVKNSLGNPTELAKDPTKADACRHSLATQRTVACSIFAARDDTAVRLSQLITASISSIDLFATLGVEDLRLSLGDPADGLVTKLDGLKHLIDQATRQGGVTFTQWSSALGDIRQAVDDAKQAVVEARQATAAVTSEVAAVRGAYKDLTDTIADTGGLKDQIQELVDLTDMTSGVQQVGEWFFSSGLAAQFKQLADNNPADCDTDWDDGLNASSDLAAIRGALGRLMDPCIAAGLASTAAIAAGEYAALVEDRSDANTTAKAILDSLETGTLKDLLDNLDSEIKVLEEPNGSIASINEQLDKLFLPGSPDDSGYLTDIAAIIDSLENLNTAGGSQFLLGQALDGLDRLINEIWPNRTYLPVRGLAACPAAVLMPRPNSGASAQVVMYQANLVYCYGDSLKQTLTEVDKGLRTAQTSITGLLQDASTKTQKGLDGTTRQIAVLSDQLAQSLADERTTSTELMQDAVAAARAKLQADLKLTLQDMGLAKDAVITALTAAVEAAQADSQQAAQALQRDFDNLMDNLGSTEPDSQTGLLGKLNGITGQVGLTGTTLDQVNTTVVTHGNNRSGELRELDLKSAQFDQAQALLDSYRPFQTEADQGKVTTVFIYHLRAKD